MRSLQQILHYGDRIGAIRIKRTEFGQCACDVAGRQLFKQVENPRPIRQAQHVAHRCSLDSAAVARRLMRNCLIEQRQRIAH